MSWYTQNTLIRDFSDWIASMFAGWTTANQISVFRIPLTGVVAYLIYVDELMLAAILYAVSTSLDFLDGAVARYQKENNIGPGVTETGKWLDPLSDKISNQVVLFALGWNYLPNTLLFISLALAGILTIIRINRVRDIIKLKDAAANGFGKIKMIVEVTLIVFLFFKPESFTAMISHTIVAIMLLLSAILLASLSLWYHLWPSFKQKIDR